MARRSKLTPKVQENFCAALQIGATIEIAAGYAGIPERTIYDWLERGRKEEERLADSTTELNPNEERYLRFSQTVRESQASAAITWLDVLDKAMQGQNPNFAMEMLERRYPREFGKQARLDLTTKGEALPAPITVVEIVKDYGQQKDE